MLSGYHSCVELPEIIMIISGNSTQEWYPDSRVDLCSLLNDHLVIPTVYFSRPRCVDDVAFQEEVVAVLKKSLQGSDVCTGNFIVKTGLEKPFKPITT